jgi:hypothetical protein
VVIKYKVRVLRLRPCGRWEFDERKTKFFNDQEKAVQYFNEVASKTLSPEVLVENDGEYGMIMKWLPSAQKIFYK